MGFVPLVDEFGVVKDIEFYEEEIEVKSFPIVFPDISAGHLVG